MTVLSKGTGPRFQSRFWTELQIGDKRMPIIGRLRYGSYTRQDVQCKKEG